jgi:hypothetical protein
VVNDDEKGEPHNQLFATLIHNCGLKNQRPALGQISISRVGQYSIGADKELDMLRHVAAAIAIWFLSTVQATAADESKDSICSYPKSWFPSQIEESSGFRNALKQIEETCKTDAKAEAVRNPKNRDEQNVEAEKPLTAPSNLSNFMQGVGQWSGADAAWSAARASWLAVLISFFGFAALFFQLNREREALTTQTGWTMYGASLSVLDMFVQTPSLRPYFYDNVPLPDDDTERSRVLAAAEVVCDHLENIVNSGEDGSISAKTYYLWVRYIRLMGMRSTVLIQFLADTAVISIDRAMLKIGEGCRYDETFKNILRHGYLPPKCRQFVANETKRTGGDLDSAFWAISKQMDSRASTET